MMRRSWTTYVSLNTIYLLLTRSQSAIKFQNQFCSFFMLLPNLFVAGVHYPTFTYSREFTWRKSYKQSDDSDAPLPADKTTTTTTLSTRVATTPPTPSTSAASLVVSPGSTCPRIENRAFLCFYYDEVGFYNFFWKIKKWIELILKL